VALPNVKVLIAEQAGQEIDATEYNLAAQTVPFETEGWPGESVLDALLDQRGFSFTRILPTEIVTIKAGRQMNTTGWLRIQGRLIIRGSLIVRRY
jgi:hypothetical protein